MLTGKVAIVTGSGRGIGAAIAEKLALKGAAVIVTDIDQATAQAEVAVIKAAGGQALAIRADVSDPDDVERMAQTAVAQFGRLDILVNNAGVSGTSLFMETTKAEMERILSVNLIGAMLCAQAAIRQMLPNGTGRVINIVSLSGQRGGIGRTAYGAAKAGLELMTKVMSVELAARGILVNNVAPGAIATEMAKVMHDAKTRDAYHYLIPQRRYGTPEEIANMVAFLASDDASHISGATFNVDGGFLSAGLMFDHPGVVSAPLPKV